MTQNPKPTSKQFHPGPPIHRNSCVHGTLCERFLPFEGETSDINRLRPFNGFAGSRKRQIPAREMIILEQ